MTGKQYSIDKTKIVQIPKKRCSEVIKMNIINIKGLHNTTEYRLHILQEINLRGNFSKKAFKYVGYIFKISVNDHW